MRRSLLTGWLPQGEFVKDGWQRVCVAAVFASVAGYVLAVGVIADFHDRATLATNLRAVSIVIGIVSGCGYVARYLFLR
ncbi:MAG: hypothetical protein AAF581_10430 [Planctomycetota bacterium]